MRTIASASEEIRTGRASAVALLQECLARIDRHEAQVRAWVLVDRERALAEARRCDEEIRRGQYRGPLHGIPLAIKDIIDVLDWPTAAGSKLWQNSIARQDATVVTRLRQAGAVLMGKTVTTQYASFDPPPTRNPWKLDRTPGGSSSGSAAAVACGMCLGALGSQTGGSLTRPASYCGVATCKPTFCRVSTHGVMTLAASMDHVGPVARTVRDLAVLLQAIAGPDPYDPLCGAEPPPDFLRGQAGQPLRVGRLRGLFEQRADGVVREMVDRACGRLTRAGVLVSETPLPAAFAEVVARHRIVMAVEAAVYHEHRLRQHPEDYGPCISSLLAEGLACPAPEYARTKEHQRQLAERTAECLRGVDVLLCPASTCPAPAAATTGDPAFNSPWSYVGFPTVSFPMELSPDGLPLAIQLVAKPWDEMHLFAAAARCEEILGGVVGEPTFS
jgi:Asp-tRNA(Asn)/Glu-tRNA(Gln) amidotransferase A subunit family amidase